MFWRNGAVKGLDFQVGDRVYRDPTQMSWYNPNRRAAIRDARTNVNNPHFAKLAALEGRGNLRMINDRMSFPMAGVWNKPSTPIIPFKQARITPIVQANLYPAWDEREVKPQSYVFMKEGGKIKKAAGGFKFFDNLESGVQSIKPVYDAVRAINNFGAARDDKNYDKKLAEEQGLMRIEGYTPRGYSLSDFISGISHYEQMSRNARNNYRASIPVTNDARLSLVANNTIAENDRNDALTTAGMWSEGISKYSLANKEYFDKVNALNTELTNKRNYNTTISNMESINADKQYANKIRSIIDSIGVQYSKDAAIKDYKVEQYEKARRSAEIQSANQWKYNDIMQRARRDYDVYSKGNPNAIEFDKWMEKQGNYMSELYNLNQKTSMENLRNDTTYRDLFGRLRYGSGYTPYGFNFDSYEDDVVRVAGSSKKGGKLSVIDKLNIENTKSTNEIQKEKVKNLLKSLKDNNKQVYELLYKLL